MAELLMDNPLSAGAQANYSKTIQDLQECIARLKEEFEDSRIPLSDDSQDLQRFCAKLEFLLQAGIKPKSSLLGGKKDYWNYISDCVASNKSLNDGIRFVKANSELKTNLGRGRALLRFALVHQRLADTLQQCVYNTAVTKDWYTPKAVWFQQQASSNIISALYDLNDLQFDLDSRGYDLDTSWPTFARNKPGAAAWQPPSRTISIGSLNSTSQEVAASVDADRLSQLEEAENERLALEHGKQELTAENKTLRDKVLELQLNANERLKATSEFEVMCGKLASELALKEETWAEKEKLYQSRLDDAQTKIDGLKDAKSQGGASAMDLIEVKGQLKVAEKTNKALKLDVTCLEKEMGAKTKVDTVKNQLIDMQEKKIEKQTVDVKRLYTRIEELIASKTQDVEKIVEANKRIEELLHELKDSTAAYKSVLAKNKELTEMLHSVEDKGQAIGKMAKEKLTKYKSENDELKAQVARLEGGEGREEVDGGNLAAMQGEKIELETRLAELQMKVEEKEASLSQQAQELAGVRAVVDTLQLSADSSAQTLTQQLMQAQQDNGRLQASIDALSATSARLEAELTEKSRAWTEQKSSFEEELQSRSRDLDAVRDRLSQSEGAMAASEERVAEERAVLEGQLGVQGAQIEALKGELTGLSQLLQDAGYSNESLEDRESCVRALVENKRGLESTVSSMHASHSDLLAQLDTAATKLGNAGSELQAMREERTQMASRVSAHEQTITELTSAHGDKCQQFDALLASFTELEGALGTLEGRVSQHNSTVATLNETIAEKDRLLQGKEEQCVAVTERVDLLQRSLADMESSRDQLQGQLHDKDTQFTQLNSQLADAAAAVGRLEASKAQLETVNAGNEEKLNALVKEVQTKDVYISEKETDVKQKSESFASLEKQLQSAEMYKKLLEEKVRTVNEKYESREKEVHALTDSHNAKSRDLEGKLIEASAKTLSLSQQINKMETQIKETESEKKQLIETKIKLSTKIESLESSCDNYIQELQNVKSECSDLSSRLSKLESINAEIVVQSDQLQTEKTDLAKQLDESNKLQNEILSQMDETNKQLTEARTLLSAAEAEVEEGQSKLTLAEKEKLALGTDLENSQALAGQLQEQISVLEQEKTATTESTNQSFFELREKLHSAECECEHVRTELQAAIASKDAMFTELTQKHAATETRAEEMEREAEARVQEVEGRLEEEERSRAQLEERVAALAQEIEAFQVSISEKDAHVGEVEERRREAEARLAEWRQSLDGKQQEIVQEKQQLEDTIEQLKQALLQKGEEMESLRDTHEQELKAVQFQLSTEQMQHHSAIQEYEEKASDQVALQEQVTSLQGNLEELQGQLEQERETAETATQRHKQQVAEWEEQVAEKDKECLAMAEQLVKQSQELDRNEKEAEVIKARQTAAEAESSRSAEELRGTVSAMEDENEQLKKKLIQLIREKDQLWQKSDKLAYKHKLRQQVWADSSSVLSCTECNSAFGLLLRRHHCRLCGQIYCHYCCNNWVMTSFSKNKERVCGACALEQSQQGSGSEGEGSQSDSEETSRDAVEDTVEIPAMRSPKWKDPDKLVLGPADLEGSTEDTQRQLEAELSHAMTSDLDSRSQSEAEARSHDHATLLSMTDESKSMQQTKQQEQTTEAPSRGRGEEPYDLITQDEVTSSADTPVPDPYTHMTGVLDQSHFASGPVEAEPELWVAAGRAFAVPIVIDSAGKTLTWEFTTYPKDINFSLCYREDEWTVLEEAETLIPMCKCNSHKKPISGELTARKAGLYTLVFDNKNSRFTSKQLKYTLELKEMSVGEDDA